MNIVRLMNPKVNTVVLRGGTSVRQGLEIMRSHGYTAIPVLDEDGKYIGCVTEGDFLWHLLDGDVAEIRELEKCRIRDLVRKDFCPALEITAGEEQVIEAVMRQNFVPIVDARGCLCGIVTRRAVIDYLVNRSNPSKE